MGAVLAVLVAVSSMLTAPSPTDEQSVAIVSYVAFELNLTEFARQKPRLSRMHPHLDWSTDGCSAPIVGSEGRTFDFRTACARHDFSYRNFSSLGFLDETLRARIDEQFRRDLYRSCERQLRTKRIRCVAWAELFVEVVRRVA